ncbi:hypothetical protein OTU49_011265 [Cherax quadricarinatus]|uniref:Mitochondrial ribosomal protein S11 n=1 Tax=Cherax quadricarinatus TaxID=27406 RepID=A0AAW0W4Q2_CHEQU
MLRSIVARTVLVAQVEARTLTAAKTAVVCPGHDICWKMKSSRCVEQVRGVQAGATTYKTDDRKEMLASMPRRDEGTEGEAAVNIDSGMRGYDGMFPDENTSDLLFDGVRFADLPIIHAKFSKNNTLLCLTDAQGVVKITRSCGIEGFKNSRKSTNIAAQTTAISLAMRALDRGIKNVRVKVYGLGAGRMSAVKGLTMGGMNVVSLTDSTPIMETDSPRPRKAKKL